VLIIAGNAKTETQATFNKELISNKFLYGSETSVSTTRDERWGSSVSIVTTLWTGRPELDFRHGQRFILFATASRPFLEVIQPPIQ
jgi:hypothetical protein